MDESDKVLAEKCNYYLSPNIYYIKSEEIIISNFIKSIRILTMTKLHY